MVGHEHVRAEGNGGSNRFARGIECEDDTAHFSRRVACKKTDTVPVLGPLSGVVARKCTLDVHDSHDTHSGSDLHSPAPSGNSTV